VKSVVLKRSILINGRKSSVSVENEFWDALREIASRKKSAMSTLVEQIDKDRDNINLSSAIRVFVFNHLRPSNGKEAEQGPNLGRPRTDSWSMWARAEECRALAESFIDAETRAVMLRITADYEFMAERLKRTAEAEHQHAGSA
jgi:predicted DNA-binding ribbon-helix-helix protein